MFVNWDHPRIRGEHAIWPLRTTAQSGSPPHTRGTLRLELEEARHHRITPAYAGNTDNFRNSSLYQADHPRIRGEHSTMLSIVSLSIGITPAYAGNTACD